MPSAQISYPQAALGYAGAQPAGGGTGTVGYFVSSAAIAQGAAVQVDATAAGTVSPITTVLGSVGASSVYIGACQDGAAGAGEVVAVVLDGPAQVLVVPGTYNGGTNLIAGGAGGTFTAGAGAAGLGNATVLATQTVTGSNGLISVLICHY